MRRVTLLTLLLLSAIGAPSALAVPPASFDPAYELLNFNKGSERATIDYTPQFNLDLAQRGATNEAQAAQILAFDGPALPFGRNFAGQLCWQKMNGCAGDIRLYDWAAKGYGNVLPILYTARNGSTISGHVWWTNRGPAKRPGVVITNGSVQAPEELYWFGAQALARAGYVVMTWEPQGQGYSDTYGEGADQQDGVPSQSGQPFYDGTEDALDFFFSTAAKPYVPVNSCSSDTSHAAKQAARVKDGRNVYSSNPLQGLLDPSRVGIIGQSLGAGAVSYIGQIDPRVKAIVAWDNLQVLPAKAPYTCKSAPYPDGATPRVPALGFAGDYPLFGTPKTSLPARNEKLKGYQQVRAAGLDSGEVVVRGGGHFEYGYIPNPAFTATERGMDMVTWYTTAWMDKYVKGDTTADARLRTDRWRDDIPERTIDAGKDANLFSLYYDSPLDTGDFHCADLRGCAGVADDGLPRPYSFLADAMTADEPSPAGQTRGTTAPAGSDDARKITGASAAQPASPSAPSSPSKPAAKPACSDVRRPTTRIRKGKGARRRGLAVSGTSNDLTGCRGLKGRVTKVKVSVARADGRQCRFLSSKGTFGAKRSCKRTSYVSAKGTKHWSFRLKHRLRKGSYKVFSRAYDRAGNIERKARSRNYKAIRVR